MQPIATANSAPTGNGWLAAVESEFDKITPIAEYGDGWLAKRDDLACNLGPDYPSGLKVRQYLGMASTQQGAPMIVGCSANSAQQIYVAAAAHFTGVQGIVYLPARKKRTAATEYCLRLGCEVVEVRPGYRNYCMLQARKRAISIGRTVRWINDRAVADAAFQAANIPRHVKRVVVPTGSGLLCGGIVGGMAMNSMADIEVVVVAMSGRKIHDRILRLAAQVAGDRKLPRVTIEPHPLGYNDPVVGRLPDGTPLDPFYAAKALGYVRSGDLLWVPGVRPVSAMPLKCRKEFGQ